MSDELCYLVLGLVLISICIAGHYAQPWLHKHETWPYQVTLIAVKYVLPMAALIFAGLMSAAYLAI
ncbi:hypothetical protein ACVBEQ_05155 [Nakamurella sp. GG22]